MFSRLFGLTGLFIVASGCSATEVNESLAEGQSWSAPADATETATGDGELASLLPDAESPPFFDMGDAAVPPEQETHEIEPSGPVVSEGAELEAPDTSVRFDPPGRGFRESLTVQLTARDAGAVVHYTLDGTPPRASSPEADGPIVLGESAVLRAVAIQDDVVSPILSQAYFKLDASLQDFSSNLPVIVAHTLGRPAPEAASRDYISGMFGLFTPETGRTTLQSDATHTSRFGIKVRGRFTRTKAKHSFTMELRGRDKEGAPAPLLGLPADSDWVLYAPFDIDRSYVRNAFGYGLSNRIGRYAPRTRFCEVFLVHEHSDVSMDDYAGIFVLVERVKRGPNRVAIDELPADAVTDPGISGGYLLNVDEPNAPSDAFTIGDLREFVMVDPDAYDSAPEQREYIQHYIEAVDRAVRAADGRDPAPGEYEGRHFGELIDVDSFIDHHILNLLMKNTDAFLLSAYLHKQRAGKLAAGPLWDLDLSMGSYDGPERTIDPHHWGPGSQSDLFHRSFWGPLFEHAEVMDLYWQRWRGLLEGPFNATNFAETLDGFAAEIREATARDRARWQAHYFEPGPLRPSEALDFDAELDFLKTWLDRRLGWISDHLDVRPPPM